MSLSATRALQRKPEWIIQWGLYHFAERVLLPPFEVRCIDQAGAAQAQFNTRMMALARGCKPGTSDMLIWQGNPSLMCPLEVKYLTGERAGQEAFAVALGRCGFPTIRACRTAAEALAGLRAAGFRLHGNADNMATLAQAQIDADLRELALRKGGAGPKKARTSRPRPTDSKSHIRRGAGIYAGVVLG